MALAITVDVSNPANGALDELRKAVSPEVTNAAIGGAARRVVQDHLRTLDEARPNALGGKRTHYYAQAARSVTYESSGDTVTVGIHHTGIAQRYFGGEIKPVTAKVLTIPAIAEAHGHRAGEFDFLSLVWPKGKSVGALVERDRTEVRITKDRRKGKSGLRVIKKHQLGGRVFFWLVAKAVQAPDPGVLPSQSLISDTATSALLKSLQNVSFSRAGGAR